MKKIKLGHRKNSYKGYTLVSDIDYNNLKDIKWFVKKGWRGGLYVQGLVSINPRKCVPIHRYILNTPKGMHTDHINHNTLDNRRENLRIATPSQNIANGVVRVNNKSGYKGVNWHKIAKKWQSRIGLKNKRINLGLFLSPIEAAYAYDDTAKKVFGEFANLNFKT